jgi:hypothetical protein
MAATLQAAPTAAQVGLRGACKARAAHRAGGRRAATQQHRLVSGRKQHLDSLTHGASQQLHAVLAGSRDGGPGPWRVLALLRAHGVATRRYALLALCNRIGGGGWGGAGARALHVQLRRMPSPDQPLLVPEPLGAACLPPKGASRESQHSGKRRLQTHLASGPHRAPAAAARSEQRSRQSDGRRRLPCRAAQRAGHHTNESRGELQRASAAHAASRRAFPPPCPSQRT